jgi:hypothetical protein
MELWTPLLLLLGITEPVMTTQAIVQPVAHVAPSVKSAQINQTQPVLTPIVIDIKYQAGQRCVIASTTQMIQRNLTLPYDQQTVYGTAQCQSDH